MKRLIGLPGETWSERGGYVYINGVKLNEPEPGLGGPGRQLLTRAMSW